MSQFKFNPEKTLEVLLYIIRNIENPDIYKCLKILYFSDKKNLENFGRFISGDSYVAMKHGPVPSGAYDIIKFIRGDGGFGTIDWETALEVKHNNLVPLREPNLDFLSESDIESLEYSINEYGDLSFSDLKDLSHDEAYDSVDKNDMISIEAIASTLKDKDLIMDHLKEG